MKSSRTYVIGTGLSPDGSVCLLADGEILVAIEKERLTGNKHDGGNDKLAMKYVLDQAGITLDDVALVVQNENFGMFRGGNFEYRDEDRLLGELSDEVRIVTISHHLAHAYSAFGPSGFDEASVLVVGDCGNAFEDCMDVSQDSLVGSVPEDLGYLYYEKDSYYHAQHGGLSTVAKDFSPWGAQGWPLSPPTIMHSIGGVCQAFSKYVFGDHASTGKLISLAPYGKPGRFDFPLFELRDGRVLVCRDAFLGFTSPAMSRAALKSEIDYYADIAYWVQKETERALLYLVRDRFERRPSRNLAYAGELALNTVANSRILREGGFEHVFIQPAAGDSGLAIGCAYYGWLQVLKRAPARGGGSAVHGASYPADRIGRAVEAARRRALVGKGADTLTTAARLLADGKIVAWYQGGAEFGPNATGHRCVLAHPGVPGMGDRINTGIKSGEDHQPFAASVLAHEAARYFACGGHDSPHLTYVFDVRPEWRDELAGVTHVDGSSRLYTVTQAREPALFRLLQEFQRLTRLPVLLSTSLNKRGRPVVETPEQAIAFFLDCGFDALVLDDLIMTKAELKHSQSASGADDKPGLIQPTDVPVLGGRIAGVGLNYELNHVTPNWLQDAEVEAVVRFTGTSRTLTLPQKIVGLLNMCDGTRTYEDIAVQARIPVGSLLQIADSLGRRGVLEHVRVVPG